MLKVTWWLHERCSSDHFRSSPGLQGGTGNDEEYLDEIYAEMSWRQSCLLYCHDMTIARWTDHEVNAIRLLTRRFGPSFWDKVIFVLTKANMIQPSKTRRMTEEEKRDFFFIWTRNNAKKFRSELKKQLEAVHMKVGKHTETEEIQQRVDSIPVIPMGSKAVQILPDGKHFLVNLLVNCLERIPDTGLANLFLQATNAMERYEEIKREWPSRSTTTGTVKSFIYRMFYKTPTAKVTTRQLADSDGASRDPSTRAEQDLQSQLQKSKQAEQDLLSQLQKSKQAEQDLQSQLQKLKQAEQDLQSQLQKVLFSLFWLL